MFNCQAYNQTSLILAGSSLGIFGWDVRVFGYILNTLNNQDESNIELFNGKSRCTNI